MFTEGDCYYGYTLKVLKKHSDETSVTAGDLCPHYLILSFLNALSIAGRPGENGGEREDRAGAKQTEEALRRAEVFPKQRSSQGIAGFCHQVKECDIPTHFYHTPSYLWHFP